MKVAVNEFLEIIETLSQHLFHANWHRNVFQYMKQDLLRGYILQVLDFAMNFNNRYQDEVQSAYWNGTQTTIHATINFYKCLTEGCNEITTLALVHILADLHHDSFLSHAAINMSFKYLVQIGVPLDLVIQFCDNCAAQYKSRRPFVEIARSAVNLIHVYFGEKHGKSHANALFGRLKSWMSYKIKSRHFIITSAYDFYTFCRQFYQTPILHGSCQYYQVEFEFIHPSDVRRHQDSDLDKAVLKTHDLYSVCNTELPLSLKVRSVPCLCELCIKDNGQECLNSAYTDPWQDVQLIPHKGLNLKKYTKRKHPDYAHRQATQHAVIESEIDADQCSDEEIGEISEDELPDISFDPVLQTRNHGKHDNLKKTESTSQKTSADMKEQCVTDAETDTRPVTDTRP